MRNTRMQNHQHSGDYNSQFNVSGSDISLVCLRSRRRNDSKAVYLTPEERRIKLVGHFTYIACGLLHF